MRLRPLAENIMSATQKFLLDENIRIEVKKFLDSKGFSSAYASKGIVNGRLAALSREKKCVLLTRDKDFINRSLFPPKQFFGIVVFRIHPPLADKLIASLEKLLAEVREFKGKLFVVREEGFEVKD